MKTVFITKNFRDLRCGTIAPFTDMNGNPRFLAENEIDKDHFTFWTEGGARLWLELCGMVRG